MLGHEHAEIDDQADLLSHGDESGGRRPRWLGMAPSRHKLEAGDRAVLEAQDRLIEDRDFLALERAPQLGFQRHPVALPRAHRWLEHLDAVAADTFGVIHRELGVLEDFLRATRLAVAERNPARRGAKQLAAVARDGRAAPFAQRLGEADDALGFALR